MILIAPGPMSDVRCPMSFRADVHGAEDGWLDIDRQWMVLSTAARASPVGSPTSDIGHRTSDQGQSNA